MTIWLSDAELRDATHRRQPAAQAKVLADWGVPYQRRPDGTLIVSRVAIEAALAGSTMRPSQPLAPANGLNF
jgi:hypothetical protein